MLWILSSPLNLPHFFSDNQSKCPNFQRSFAINTIPWFWIDFFSPRGNKFYSRKMNLFSISKHSASGQFMSAFPQFSRWITSHSQVHPSPWLHIHCLCCWFCYWVFFFHVGIPSSLPTTRPMALFQGSSTSIWFLTATMMWGGWRLLISTTLAPTTPSKGPVWRMCLILSSLPCSLTPTANSSTLSRSPSFSIFFPRKYGWWFDLIWFYLNSSVNAGVFPAVVERPERDNPGSG